MNRALALIGFLCGVAALVVVAARRRPSPLEPDTLALERRIADLEAAIVAAREGPNPVPREALVSKSVTPAKASKRAREPAEWPVVARKLTIDLRLDTRQADIVDKTLEECSKKLGAAEEHEDALWRDRLSKRARKAAHQAIAAALSEKQRAKFDEWLKRPDYSHYACWFLPERKCGGCGKKKPKKSAARGSKVEEKK